MRHVTVARFALVKVLQPLLHLAVLADLERRQAIEGGLGADTELGVDA